MTPSQMPCPICGTPFSKREVAYVHAAELSGVPPYIISVPILRIDLTCDQCGVFRSEDRETCHLYADRRAFRLPIPESFTIFPRGEKVEIHAGDSVLCFVAGPIDHRYPFPLPTSAGRAGYRFVTAGSSSTRDMAMWTVVIDRSAWSVDAASPSCG